MITALSEQQRKALLGRIRIVDRRREWLCKYGPEKSLAIVRCGDVRTVVMGMGGDETLQRLQVSG